MNNTNELRVFISSTFRDLQEEREHLIKKIFPEIRSLCGERGIRFTEVDLRWGLTDEDVALGRVISTCLEEVEKCRPYFIGITGDRYGFIPSYTDIHKDPALLEQFPWIEDAVVDEMSITEMEAQYGVLQNRDEGGGMRDESERVLFYFRRHRASLDDTNGDSEDFQRLEAYQRRIRNSGVRVEEFRDLVSLGEMIHDDLIRIIKRDFAEARPPTPLEQERSRHAAFSLSRRRAYIPNPKYLKALNDHVASDDPPLVMYAESGSGKSSLFAYWAEQYRRKNPEAHIIEHYVGIGATATDHYAIIQHVCMEIKERFAREEEIPTIPEELEKAFGQWLGYAEHGLRQEPSPSYSSLIPPSSSLILILDGLNQLQGNALNLKWIPDVISSSIRLILSSTVEGTLVELKKRNWKQLGMQALLEAEREAVVVRYLAEYHKSLNTVQIKQIASDYKCGHPLFLKTLLEELRLVGQHELLDERITTYLESTGTEDLFQRVLERLEEDYNMRAVREVMTLLWASRSGLDEREIAEVSGVARLKIATMIAGLDYHLVRKEGRLTFFHDYLRRAIEKRYLGDDQTKRRTHLRLAEYFEKGGLNQRSASERAWQYSLARDDAKLVAMLANLEVLQLLYKDMGVYEVLTHWSRLRDAGHDPQAIYRESLNHHTETADVAEQLKSSAKVAEILQQLSIWSGAMDIYRQIGEVATIGGLQPELAGAELSLGWMLQLRGESAEAMERLEHALRLYEELGDRRGVSKAIGNMGVVYYDYGEYDRALENFQRQLTICEELGDRNGVAIASGNMGNVYSSRGEYEDALKLFERATVEHRAIGFRFGLTYWLEGTGRVLLELAQAGGAMPEYLSNYVPGAINDPSGAWRVMSLRQARAHAEECVSTSGEIAKPDMLFSGQVLLARIEAADGDHGTAEQRLGELLKQAEDNEQRAELHYWLWRLGDRRQDVGGRGEHGGEALRLYRALFEKAPKYEYKQRIEELQAAGETS